MPDLAPFGEWLKRRRKLLDLTRAELAKRANCSTSTLRRLEAADLRASKQFAETLANALAIPADQQDSFVKFARGDARQFAVFSGQSSVSSDQTKSDSRVTPHASNLPAPLTSLVGRKTEITAVSDLLRQPGVRLLTLTGPPGTGKTRLSIAVANQMLSDFPDGVTFIPLASITDPDLLVPTIAQTFSIGESGRREILLSLKEFLRPKRLLLVFDNFEQIVTAAPLLTDLLTAAPHVKALVTSREVLGVYGENEFPLPPFAFPDANRLPSMAVMSFYSRYPSIQLFKERARAVKPDFKLTMGNVADVARICAWLDGLPLAIEMAAAQTKWFPTKKVFEGLSDRLAALTGGPRDLTPRQQSLRGAIEWSYNLLDADERRLFDVLGVFVGGCDEDAILDLRFQISNLDGADREKQILNLKSEIRNLVDKSLLQHEITLDGESRYWMLETIREFAREQLSATREMERARQAHAEHYLALAEAALPHLSRGGDQITWYNRVEREHNNLRAVLAWATETPERGQFALLLVDALCFFWKERGYLSEARRWVETILVLDNSRTEVRARVLNQIGEIARAQGDYEQARKFVEQALAIVESLGDEMGIGVSLETLGVIAGSQGDYVRAAEFLEKALVVRQKIGDAALILSNLNNLAITQRRLGNRARAAEIYQQAVQLSREKDSLKSLSHALHGLAELRVENADYAAALELFRECLAIRNQLGNRPGLILSLEGIALAFYHIGDGIHAATLYSASQKLRSEMNMPVPLATRSETEQNIARVRELAGESEFAKAWAEGERMTMEDAVALALSKTTKPPERREAAM